MLQRWQSKAGLGHAPRTILMEFSRIDAADIVSPLPESNRRQSFRSLLPSNRFTPAARMSSSQCLRQCDSERSARMMVKWY